MKIYLNCIVVAFSIWVFAGCVSQKAATKEEMTHEYIVDYPGLTKDVIFNRTLKWIANNFRSSKSVIEYQDKDAGSIVGNSTMTIQVGIEATFTMNLDIKDSKARYRFINLGFYFKGSIVEFPSDQWWHRAAKNKFDSIVNSLQIATNKSDDF